MKQFYSNCIIVTDGVTVRDRGVLVENGTILDVCYRAPEDAEVIDLGGCYLMPGLIDLHCHGGDGEEFIDGDEESIRLACELHAAHGTRVLYPTISAADYETTYRALEGIEKVRDRMPLLIPGVHLEGPYLAPEMCGAQDTGVIRPPKKEEYEALYERFGSLIARWSYAPERDVDGAFLAFLKEKGIIPATAHSAAEYSHMEEALRGGNRLVTHLYSCTSTITRDHGFRRLGVIETAFLRDDIYVEIICDGKHLPPDLIRLIYRIKGADKIALITDSLALAGTSQTQGRMQNTDFIIEDGVCKLLDRSAFAGSIATADRLVRVAVQEADIPLIEAVKMITKTPATIMGLTQKGSLATGMDADMVVFDDDINIHSVFAMGEKI